MNLRVVVMVVFASAPNLLMVKKMKFCPTAPHKQNTRMSQAASGCDLQKWIASSPPPPGTRNMYTLMYSEPHRFIPTMMSHDDVLGYLQTLKKQLIVLRSSNPLSRAVETPPTRVKQAVTSSVLGIKDLLGHGLQPRFNYGRVRLRTPSAFFLGSVLQLRITSTRTGTASSRHGIVRARGARRSRKTK